MSNQPGLFSRLAKGFTNWGSGATRKVGTAASYASGQAQRLLARGQNFGGLENKYKFLSGKAAANQARLEKSLTNRKEGENLNAYRKRLAKERLNRQAASRKAMLNRFMGYKGEGAERTSRFGRFGRRTLNFLQNVAARKLGRTKAERNANWAAHYAKKRKGYENSMNFAREADENAKKLNDARLAFMGLVWLSITGLPGKVKALFDSLATLTPPDMKKVWEDFESAVSAGLKEAKEDTEKLLKDLAEFMSTGATNLREKIKNALSKINIPDGRRNPIMAALDAAYSAVVSSSSAAAAAAAAAGGAAMVKAGQIASAIEGMPSDLKAKLCSQLTCPCNTQKSNNGSHGRANANLRAKTKANQNALQPAANKLKAWAAGLKEVKAEQVQRLPNGFIENASRRNRRSTRRK